MSRIFIITHDFFTSKVGAFIESAAYQALHRFGKVDG
jgi:hypothetical protein